MFCEWISLELQECFKATGWYFIIQILFQLFFLTLCIVETESEEETDEPEDRQPSPEPLQDSPSNANSYEPHPVR